MLFYQLFIGISIILTQKETTRRASRFQSEIVLFCKTVTFAFLPASRLPVLSHAKLLYVPLHVYS